LILNCAAVDNAPQIQRFPGLRYHNYISDKPGEHAFVSARSDHAGVVVVCFGDGHTSTVSDDVDLALWWAAGSRNGEEPVDIDF
jgi:hypothetical protein